MGKYGLLAIMDQNCSFAVKDHSEEGKNMRRVGLVLLIIALAVYGIMMKAQEATPEATEEMGDMEMEGMEMDTGFSVDDLAPLAMGYYEGDILYFIHPEASDEGVAAVLTEMMGPDVYAVPGLAEVPAELLGKVWVFTNGIEAMGPLGFQPDVFDTVPGDEGYTPLRAIQLVTWAEGSEARELMSLAEIEEAEAAGEITIEAPGVVVNMPILVWPGGTR